MRKINKVLFLILLIPFFLSISAVIFFVLINGPRTTHIMGQAQSTDGQFLIQVIYRDYGGSYAERGGQHMDAYIMKNELIKKKKAITLQDNVPCSVGLSACTMEVIDNQSDNCLGKVYVAINGQNRCVTKQLENFEVNGDQLKWYGEMYSFTL